MLPSHLLIKTQHIHLKQIGLTWALRVCHNLNQELRQKNNENSTVQTAQGRTGGISLWMCQPAGVAARLEAHLQLTSENVSIYFWCKFCLLALLFLHSDGRSTPEIDLVQKVGKVRGFSVRSKGQNYSIYPKAPFSPSEVCGRWASADRCTAKPLETTTRKSSRSTYEKELIVNVL